MNRSPTAAGARWVAAGLLILYGFSKVNGAQFRMLDSELSKPLGDVSGFWLTWYYFGYSPIYKVLLAGVEIIGGILLVIPQTSLLAALILLPVAANILVVDILFGVAALPTALIVLVCVLIVITGHARALWSVVWLAASEQPLRRHARHAIVGVMVVASFLFNRYLGTAGIQVPTAIDGTWSVAEDTRPVQSDARFSRVFFELNRAWMVVFRDEAGTDRQHHFEVADGGVKVWEHWRSKGRLIMEGVSARPDRIELNVIGGGHIRLERVSGPIAR